MISGASPQAAMASASEACTLAPSAAKARLRETTRLGRPGSGFFGRLSQVLRPMMTGLPSVACLKNACSPLMRQGIALSLPITPFCATAAMRERRELTTASSSLRAHAHQPHGKHGQDRLTVLIVGLPAHPDNAAVRLA